MQERLEEPEQKDSQMGARVDVWMSRRLVFKSNLLQPLSHHVHVRQGGVLAHKRIAMPWVRDGRTELRPDTDTGTKRRMRLLPIRVATCAWGWPVPLTMMWLQPACVAVWVSAGSLFCCRGLFQTLYRARQSCRVALDAVDTSAQP
jgi:hypothetical protein